ncbi:Cytochrome c-556 [bacterium HR40]|nr:Cytochrome c-556 [bacterium HR40]
MFARIVLSTVAAAMAAGLVWQMAEAQQKVEPKGVVAYRIAVMRTLGAQMLAIKTALTETPEFEDNLVWHAQIVHDASKLLVDLFPKGSNEAPSAALPVVWEKWSEFEAAAKRLEELSAKFVEVAKNGDPQATLAAFGQLGKEGCSSCHDTFRKKQG